MNSKEFLDNLLLHFGSSDIENIGFDDVNNYNFTFFDTIEEKKIICVSSGYFEENMNIISNLKNRNYFESIISLPIFKEDDNLLVLIFNPQKNSPECLYIDESDSLIHKSEDVDWTYAGEELTSKILSSYNNFEESDNAVMLNIDEIFGLKPKSINDELLSLSLNSKEDVSTRKHRVITNDLADGLLALKQNQPIENEFSKHDLKAVETPQSITLPFLNDAMYYKKRQNPKKLLYKDNKPLIDGEVQFRKLGKLADLENIYIKNEKNSILIATCKSCTSKLVFYNNEISDFKGEVYIEVTNIHEDVSMEYLYEYLNSTNGLDELLYFSKGNTHITPNEIKNVKIPVPELDIQKEIVKVSRESREFFKSVDLLKKEFNSNILDYKHMQNSISELKGNISFDNKTNEITELSRSWRHAYKGLIWPLAISYLSATKGGFEIVEKKDNYLILFEFIAAFNAIVMLSGLPNDVYKKNFKKIWNSRNPYEYQQMTFANWVYLCNNLSNVYKFNNFTSELDEDLFEKIGSEKILNILEFAKNLRNDEAHGSHSNAYEAKQIVEELNVYLDDIFDILEVYSNYKLIYVTGDMKSDKQAYSHRVILLNGPCAQPIYDNIRFDTPLDRESLYLYNPKNNKKLILKDSLIKFCPIDDLKKRWALFIYYSCDRKEFNAFYKCFQSNEEDIKVNISSLEKDVLGKINNKSFRY